MAAPEPVYRTVFTVEVFSRAPLVEWMSLGDVAYVISEGDCIGNTEQGASDVVPPGEVEAHLIRIGNDGTFFSGYDDEDESYG